MKIIEFLGESATDVVARFYKESSKDSEKFYNPEVVKYKKKNQEYYDEHFKEWFDKGIVPVFTRPVTAPQPEYTNDPKKGKLQTPGYRGLHYALAAAGLPYNHKVQAYRADPSRLLATQTMDGAKNSNGQ